MVGGLEPPVRGDAAALDTSAACDSPEPDVDSYIVYLSGAGTMDPARMEEKERQFIELLQSHLPRSVLITDVFPYSATNNPQLGERRLARLWRYAWRARNVRHRSFFQWLSVHAQQLRNTLQVAVSGDRRYGPIFSYGVSQVIAAGLLRHGYRLGSDKPVILVVLSGSGQISVGCVPILRRLLRRPIWIASIGGILTDDPASSRWSTSTTCPVPSTTLSTCPGSSFPASGPSSRSPRSTGRAGKGKSPYSISAR